MSIDTIKKDCATCLYLATHEKCGKGAGCCLGTPAEVDSNDGKYLFKNWEEGDGIDRVRQFERDGLRSIVIGGQGEAEVNVKDSPEFTFENLCNVAEQCGYLISRGVWVDHYKVIVCALSHGCFELTYYNNVLDSIDHIMKKRCWSK